MSAWADPRYSRRGSRPLAGCWKAPSGAILVAHAGGAKGPQHCYPAAVRRGGRAVEGTGLENRRARKGLVGSNPTPSADSASPGRGGTDDANRVFASRESGQEPAAARTFATVS